MFINKRLFLIYALALVLALVLIQCGSDDPTEPTDPLAGAALCLSDSSCAMGGVCDTSAAIEVANCGNSTVLSWTAVDDAEWLSVSVANGETPAQFCIMADSNRTGAERTATVTVTADDMTDESGTIDVSQPTLSPTLCVSVSDWEPSALQSESPQISVTNCGDMSSFDWQVAEDEDWLELSAANGSTPGSFTITVDTNNTGESRTGTVTVTAEGVAGSPWQITVVQPRVVMVLVSSYDTNGKAVDVCVTGDYAYVADGYSGLQIFDVSDPSTPTLTDSCDTDGNARGVFALGDYAYVADGSCGLQIIDVTDPSSLTLTGGYNTTGLAYGVFVTGDYAYVADYLHGLKIIDVSDPSTPTLTGSYDTDNNAEGVFVTGDYAYVADGSDGLQIIDVSDPSSPTLTGSYGTYYAHRVFVTGDYAYVADAEDGVKIIDISDPSTPTLTGSYDTDDKASGVFVTGDYAYVADGESGGVQIINVSDPSSPTLTGSCDTDYSARTVFVAGDYAYVADGDGGLLIFEIRL